VNARIAYDASLHTASAGFELWLDQRDEGRRSPCQCGAPPAGPA
jgi:hypothetical protein